MKRIIEILNEIRPEFDFEKSGDFIASGMLDSYDMVLLVTELESHFAITIDGMDIVPDNFNNLENISRLVAKYGARL